MESYHDLMRAAAETRRTAEWQAAMRRARQRRMELIVITVVLMAAFGVAGFFGGRWVENKRDADAAKAAATTLPDPAVVDTPTFTMEFPSAPAQEDIPQTIGDKSVPSVGWTLDQGDIKLALVAVDFTSLVPVGAADPALGAGLLLTFHDESATRLAAEGSGTVTSTVDATTGPDPTRRSDIQTVEGRVFVTSVLHGSMIVSFACTASLDAEPAECIDAFATLRWKA